MFVLVALAGCFLALSAALVASAGMSGDSGSGARAGGTSHLRREQPERLAADFQFQGKSPDHKSGLDAASPSGGGVDPCLSSATACSGAWDQGGDGPAAGNWQTTGSSAVTGNSSPGDRDILYPSSGFNFFGAGGLASGQFPDTGGHGGSSQNGGTTSTSGTLPSTAGPDPETTSSPSDPTTTPSQLSLFFPTGSPGPEDPTGQTDNDPPPPGAATTYSVPEPSTFWLLIASLTVLVLAHSRVARARPASRIRLRSIATKRWSFPPAANPPS